MSAHDHLPLLPLMLAGVARPVAELLREVGLPLALLPGVALAAEGVGRFVLYDSRSTRSSLRARRAKGQGLQLIDVARFKPVFNVPRPSLWRREHKQALIEQTAVARTLVENLKSELEARGGIWLRIADCPFPYQQILCTPQQTTPEATDSSSKLPAWLRGENGHTSFTIPSHSSCGENSHENAWFIWQTTVAGFARWWQLRRKISIQVWPTDHGYEIHTTGDLNSFPLAVELWRGNHLAALPLRQPVLNVRTDGLAFCLTNHHLPAVLQSHRPISSDASDSTWIVPNSIRVA